VLGLPEAAPFDRVLVSAEARALPEPLVDQLHVGGRMVVPVAGRMLLVVRGEEAVDITAHGRYRFVPLV
jgi:protein-L-isoaspartate(D-aspartate) O-methyltransferase